MLRKDDRLYLLFHLRNILIFFHLNRSLTINAPPVTTTSLTQFTTSLFSIEWKIILFRQTYYLLLDKFQASQRTRSWYITFCQQILLWYSSGYFSGNWIVCHTHGVGFILYDCFPLQVLELCFDKGKETVPEHILVQHFLRKVLFLQ